MNTTLHRLGPALTVLCLAGLTACGSGDAGTGAATAEAPSAASASTADPCSLVPETALEQQLGVALSADGFATAEAGGLTCHWTFPDRPEIPGALAITRWHGREFFSTSLGEPTTGIGDEARADTGLGVVLTRLGDEVVQVQILSPDHRDATDDIARLAVEAL